MSQARAADWSQGRRQHVLLHVQLAATLLGSAALPLVISLLLDLSWIPLFCLAAVSALLCAQFLARRLLHSMQALLSLTQLYTQRHFEERLHVSPWDALSPLAGSMHEMAQDLVDSEHEQLRAARYQSELSRFLRPELAAQIATGEQPLMLNGQRRTITVVFIDLVGFNNFSETAPPTQVVRLLQEIVAMTTDLVFRHCGVIDKSVGDCVMAVFGVPGLQDDHALRALAAAEDIQRFAAANVPKWQRAFGVDIKLSIGIATGEAVVGDLGSEARLEYTAVGNVVSVAARLAALARPGQTLLTEQVAAKAPQGFDFSPMGEQALLGRRAPMSVLELR